MGAARRAERSLSTQEMPQYTESIEIASATARVWELIAAPERWSEGYRRTSLRA